MRLDLTAPRPALLKRRPIGLLSLLLTLQTGCFSIGGEAQLSKNIPEIKQVNIQGDALLLEGYSLERVEKVYLKDTKKTYEYKVTSKDSGSLVSQAMGSFLVMLDKTYDLILESADAEVLNQVTVSLDGAVGGTLSGSLAIPSGKLAIGDAWNELRPSPLSKLHITSSSGGDSSGGISSEGLTLETLLATSTQNTYVSLFSGGQSDLAGFLRFGATQSGENLPTSFYIGSESAPKAFGVTSDGKVGIGTAWNPVTRPSPLSKLHITSSSGGNSSGGISSEGLTLETLLATSTQNTYVSLFSGGQSDLAGFLRFGATQNGENRPTSFYIGSESAPKAFGVTSDGKVGIGTAWNPVTRPSPLSKLHITSSSGGTSSGEISSEGLTIETLFPHLDPIPNINSSPATRTYVSLFSGSRVDGNGFIKDSGAGYLRFGPTENQSSFFIGPEGKGQAFSVTNTGNTMITGNLLLAPTPTSSATFSVTNTGDIQTTGTLSLGSSPQFRVQLDSANSNINGSTGNDLSIVAFPSPTPSSAGDFIPTSFTPVNINRMNGITTFTSLKRTNSSGIVAIFRNQTDVNTFLTSCSLSANNLSCTSDRRLKKDIQPLQGALDKVLAIDGVSYRWKSEPQGARQVGFIAQDLQKTVPELVIQDADPQYLQVAYAPYVAVVHQALKELYQKIFSPSGEITLLKKKIREQEDQIQTLARRLERLEKELDKKVVSRSDRAQLKR